jgi:hypothetical protein
MTAAMEVPPSEDLVMAIHTITPQSGEHYFSVNWLYAESGSEEHARIGLNRRAGKQIPTRCQANDHLLENKTER